MNPLHTPQIAYAPAGDSETGNGNEKSGTLTQAKNAITSTARDTAARIKSVASETADRAKDQAQQIASETKQTAADRIGGYGSAMHDSAKSFEQQDPNIAWATHEVAGRIDRVADYVRNTDMSAMRRDAENWARRHPVAFFGGLFVGGLIVGNLLTARPAAAAEEDETQWEEDNVSGSETIPEFSDTLNTPESPANGGI